MFKPNTQIYFRIALQAVTEKVGDSEQRIKDWLSDPQTKITLFQSYPALASRVYPLKKSLNIFKDPQFFTTLENLYNRSTLSTVPLGMFVAVGSAEIKSNQLHSRKSRIDELSVSFYSGEPDMNWLGIDSSLKEIKHLQTNPVFFFKNKKVYFLKPIFDKEYSKYEWHHLPSNKLLQKLMIFLSEPHKVTDVIKWLKVHKVSEDFSREILSKAIKESLILSNLLEDRFFLTSIKKNFKIKSKSDFIKIENIKDLVPSVVVTKNDRVEISNQVIQDVEQAALFIMTLEYLATKPPQLLEDFRSFLHKEYDTRSAFFLDLIDPFRQSSLTKLSSTTLPKNPFPEIINSRLGKILEEKTDLQLSREEVKKFLALNPIPEIKLPEFSVSFLLGESGQASIRKVFGGPGVRPLQRFQRYLMKNSSDTLAKLPKNFIYAEIGGGPQTNKRNLFERNIPETRPYINCFNQPRLDTDVISLSELRVILHDGIILLWSDRKNKFVIPVQTNAVNQTLDEHPACILLNIISQQFQMGEAVFPWDGTRNLRWMPRVLIGKTVVSPQQWSIPVGEVQHILENQKDIPRAIKNNLGLAGDLFTIHIQGKELILDLKSTHVKENLTKILSICKFSKSIVLQEKMKPEDNKGLYFENRKLATEFILPFKRDVREFVATTVVSKLPSKTLSTSFSIFSSGEGQNNFLEKFDEHFRNKKLKYFFIRTGHLGDELKIRIFFNNTLERESVRRKIFEFLSLDVNRSLYRRWLFEEYQPEVDVYNKPEVLKLYHEISCADSLASLHVIKLLEDDNFDERSICVVAWMSCVSYAKWTRASRLPKMTADLSRAERELVYDSKKIAIDLMKFTDGQLAKIFNERNKILKNKLNKKTISQMSQPERNFFYRRLSHLSLNRLSANFLLKYEGIFVSQSTEVLKIIHEESNYE